MIETEHPWQKSSTELIYSALEHIMKGTESDLRVGFLLLDVGVETVLRTYLRLPEEVDDTRIPFQKRQQAASGNFHDVVRAVSEVASSKVSTYDAAQIHFFHDIRNRLYHDGSGITVPATEVRQYAYLAVVLLEHLLDVNLHMFLPEVHEENERKRLSDEAKRQYEIESMRKEIIRSMDNAKAILEVAAARIHPVLITSQFAELLEEARLGEEAWKSQDEQYDSDNVPKSQSNERLSSLRWHLAVTNNMRLIFADFQLSEDLLREIAINVIEGWEEVYFYRNLHLAAIIPIVEGIIEKSDIKKHINNWYDLFMQAERFPEYVTQKVILHYDSDRHIFKFALQGSDEIRNYKERIIVGLNSIRDEISRWLLNNSELRPSSN